jgi:phage gp36-like protein
LFLMRACCSFIKYNHCFPHPFTTLLVFLMRACCSFSIITFFLTHAERQSRGVIKSHKVEWLNIRNVFSGNASDN